MGPMLPHMEYTLSKAIILGVSFGYSASFFSRSARSLCSKMTFLVPECRMPWIMLAWFILSEKITQPGILDPRVDKVASFAT